MHNKVYSNKIKQMEIVFYVKCLVSALAHCAATRDRTKYLTPISCSPYENNGIPPFKYNYISASAKSYFKNLALICSLQEKMINPNTSLIQLRVFYLPGLTAVAEVAEWNLMFHQLSEIPGMLYKILKALR